MNRNHSTQKKLRSLGNARENPNVGKPNEREREIYIASGKYISAAAIQFPTREKYLTAPQNYPKFSTLKNVPRKGCTAQLNSTQKQCQIHTVRTAPEPSSSPTENIEKDASIFVPSQPILRTVRIVQYGPLFSEKLQ
jgi:hypothetical protein